MEPPVLPDNKATENRITGLKRKSDHPSADILGAAPLSKKIEQEVKPLKAIST
jgi:hypothetical protein